MGNSLRYTGCWPPIDVLAEYPNWVLALDEEHVKGQDETTLKPEAQQSWISCETSCTAADVTLADGSIKTGILVLEEGDPSALDVFDGNDWWSVEQVSGKKWETVKETWLGEEERRPSVSFAAKNIFPLSARSRLPRADGTFLHLSIRGNGKAELNWG